jgi:hypothetical protein
MNQIATGCFVIHSEWIYMLGQADGAVRNKFLDGHSLSVKMGANRRMKMRCAMHSVLFDF